MAIDKNQTEKAQIFWKEFRKYVDNVEEINGDVFKKIEKMWSDKNINFLPNIFKIFFNQSANGLRFFIISVIISG